MTYDDIKKGIDNAPPPDSSRPLRDIDMTKAPKKTEKTEPNMTETPSKDT